MRKSKALTYIVILSIASIGLIISVLTPSLAVIQRMEADKVVLDYSKFDIFITIMATHNNYLSSNSIIVFNLFAFALGLNYLFFADKPGLIVRLKSRTDYVKKHIIDILIFSLLFVILVEVIHIVYSFVVFGERMTIKSGLLPYSALDFATEFLFYMRAGIVLFIAGILTNKKFAPMFAFAIYLAEYFFLESFLNPLESNRIWLPYKDAVVVTSLLTESIQPTSVVPIIIRGIIMNTALLIISFFLFKKKDVIENEKK